MSQQPWDDQSVMKVPPEEELQGPLHHVPAHCFDMTPPAHWIQSVVELCLTYRTGRNYGAVASQRVADDQRLAAALALRDPLLLASLGFDIRTAWAEVRFPETIAAIRRELAWQLTEIERIAADRALGVTDLFDAYDINLAARRAARADGEAGKWRDQYGKWLSQNPELACRASPEQFEEEQAARMGEAYSAVLRELLAARHQRDAQQLGEAIEYYGGMAPSPTAQTSN